MTLALKGKRSATINVIEDRFILPLLSINQLCHTNNALSDVDMLRNFCSVYSQLLMDSGPKSVYQLKAIPLRNRTNGFPFRSNVSIRVDEMCIVLLGVVLLIELIKLEGLIAMVHMAQANPLRIRLHVQVRFATSYA